ncbi:integrase/recombinase xerD homolog [Haliotis asinina]|uniref:integrase/recombinase xerD homolog n=1 Tax=Haliotis asinina TaxID=109174 RepID=UPI003531C956
MSLLSYAGFFRFSEVVNIKRNDITFEISIFIRTSKTDVYRDGRTVLISVTSSPTCPVTMLKRYLEAADLVESSEDYIFRQLCYCKRKSKYKLKGKSPLSYTRARETLLEKLKFIGEDTFKIGLHSFRSGVASAVANDGVPDRLFKRHGRWASETAKDGYVKDDINSLLLVSANLGI